MSDSDLAWTRDRLAQLGLPASRIVTNGIGRGSPRTSRVVQDPEDDHVASQALTTASHVGLNPDVGQEAVEQPGPPATDNSSQKSGSHEEAGLQDVSKPAYALVEREFSQLEMEDFFAQIFNSLENGNAPIQALDGQWTTLSVFLECIRDTDSLKAYLNLLLDHLEDIRGKCVLDIGCGIGLLSLICAKLGAQHTYAVDSTPFSAVAARLAFQNGCKDVISFIPTTVGLAKSVKESAISLIVSDWLGMGFFKGNLLSSVIKARDQLVVHQEAPKILPGAASLYICGISEDSHHVFNKRWKHAGDVDYSPLRLLDVTTPVYGDCVNPSSVCTTSGLLHVYDLASVKLTQLRFTTEFCLLMTKDLSEAYSSLPVSALMIYCDVSHQAGGKFFLSTKPSAPRNRYGQTVLCFPTPLALLRGSELNGRITYVPPVADGIDPVFVLEYCVDGGQVHDLVYGMLDAPPVVRAR